MTTELTLLLALTVFIVLGAFNGDKGPSATFNKSAPRLGARIEAQLSTGRGFKVKGKVVQWEAPDKR